MYLYILNPIEKLLDIYIPVLLNYCVFPIMVCSHFMADSFVNTQIHLKMTIKNLDLRYERNL